MDVEYKLATQHPFPYGHPGKVCYFELRDGGGLAQCRSRDSLREAVSRAVSGATTIYAVWPGQYRSDLFRIDDPNLLAWAIAG